MTLTDILKRCCESPDLHLAERTIPQFQAYALGYEFHANLEPEDFDYDAFTDAVKGDYGVCDSWPSNVATWSFLEAVEGAERSLSRYLDYRTRLASPTRKAPEVHARVDLFKGLSSMEAIRKRPGMYFGNDAAASHLWSMLSGCSWAEMDTTGKPGKAHAFQALFQSWIEERFPFSNGIPWHRTFHFVSLGSAERSLSTFFDHFDLFQSGERPDCLSKTARTIMKNIAEEFGTDPSDMEDAIKRIAPI
ncbi:hypothetical protein OKA05_20615 [Luteolibacter arcticus]|uniref:Uncharacterized protein n=1 Tax=Luteolibacter arcticus TaxID=1581411 RepID=A0ABT3GN98_9BACT|nr:hypothetical protein [Luteolibacter arcticus]MCW1924978.1 hypothetical protein [Luteolibacter arcticus]